MRRLFVYTLATLLALGGGLYAQTHLVQLGSLNYYWPTSPGSSGDVLINNGTGSLTWGPASPGGSAVMPTGAIVYSTAGSCPGGYTEYTAGQGRYVVSINGGSTTTTVGTALTNTENRPVGTHNHTASESVSPTAGSHTHTFNDATHTHTVLGEGSLALTHYPSAPYQVVGRRPGTTSHDVTGSGTGATVTSTAPSATGSQTATINNAGSVTGTNAPYVQLIMCQKS